MKSMRQLINLMEGVMPVPGIGQSQMSNGSESDMQDAGTADRNNSYASFNAAQQPATESQWAEQENSPEVQQAMADFENMVMNIYMDPDTAYDKIVRNLDPESIKEFNTALEAAGHTDNAESDIPQPNDFGDIGSAPPDHNSYDDAFNDDDEENMNFDEGIEPSTEKYVIYDIKTNEVVGGPYSTRQRAARAADKKDLQYGAIRYGVRLIKQVAEEIELATDDVDQPAYYIIANDGLIASGPFNSQHDAERHAHFVQWYDPSKYEIQYGIQDQDGYYSPVDEDYSGVAEDFNLNNGYEDIYDASGNDYFPTGADSPVINSAGPSGSRQGDNDEQKKMQVAEVHKELVYGYRNYLNENSSIKEKITPWGGYTSDDPKANALAKSPKSTMNGTEKIPFSQMVQDTINTHGVKWAFEYYVKKHGLPPRQFKIFAGL